ncbi:MAG: hypothetical protein JXM72_06540 [Deltaproteobacteria bacterium]|nr:hypothetical protein [Deltaproteobacteria bacterium]
MAGIGDIVAIYIDDKPSVYARIEDITRDIKSHWFQVRLLFLSFPVQETTWILRKEYLEGSSFTMKDLPVRIVPLSKPGLYDQKRTKITKTIPAEVISIENMRKKMKHKNPDT